MHNAEFLSMFNPEGAIPTPSQRRRPQVTSVASMVAVLVMSATSGGWRASAQSASFAGNAQHTAVYNTPARRLNRVLWSTQVDRYNSSSHYGAPLITPANTVVVPTLTVVNGGVMSLVNVFAGATGIQKYTLTNDYVGPNAPRFPYQPVIATPSSGLRLYYAGAGGTVYYIDNLDSDTPGTPVQQCFYTDLDSYRSNASAFNSTVFINTSLTADTNGVIFFGFLVQSGAAPAPLSTTNFGFARIDPAGNASYVLAPAVAGDPQISRVPNSCAPALSNDGTTLYVIVKGLVVHTAFLAGLDSSTLATKFKAPLLDPRNGQYAGIDDSSTASPMVGPDGDVFFAVSGNPNSLPGFLLHFSADLKTSKLPGAFGWDYTAAVVPTNMLPSYRGPSSYLIFSKYNNYQNGIHKIALLDPNAIQTAGVAEMREVMTVIGPTPNGSGLQVKEWCINTAAVNPVTSSVFAPNEDGHLYRWNLAANSLTEALKLNGGVGEPYVPTVIGPDGTVYTINGGTLFALGDLTNMEVAVFSSVPDLVSVVAGQPVTFTAIVTNLNPADPAPSGTVTFEDRTYEGSTPVTNILAASVPLSNYVAAVTTSSLASNHGNHFITAIYSGGGAFQSASATLVQRIHASATTTALVSAVPVPGSNFVTFTAMIAPTLPGTSRPTGMVSFWDGPNFLAQSALDSTGRVFFATTNLGAGHHAVLASYYSDTIFASSIGWVAASPPILLTSPVMLGDGSFKLGFTNASGAPFTVLGTTDLLLPLTNWDVIGPAIETLPGQFQFNHPQASNNNNIRFYSVRSP
jgi:hypothetical protein